MTVEVDLLGRTVVHDEPDYEGRNYIVRHWVGALSLAQSYWVNGVLIGLPLNLYLRLANFVPSERPIDFFEWKLLPYVLSLILLVWQYVGIWRSAGTQIRAGRPGWAWVARIVIILGALASMNYVAITAKSAWTMWAVYIDQKGAVYTAAEKDGRVTFSGEITPESADRLEALLNKKGVNRLIIRQSIGGFVLPTLRLAKIIQNKNLTVVVTRECASMCTVLLAAGAERYVLPETVIGLHAASVVGTGERSEEGWADVEAVYKRAGAQEDLLKTVRAHHGPLDLYEPTIDELIRNGLVTGVFDRRLSGYLPAYQWCAENPQPCAQTGRQNLAATGQGR